MHELPLTENIIRLAEKHGRESRASKVESIVLVVGEQSGFIGESIQMYFDALSKGGMCEGAVLEIKPVAPKLRCASCGALFRRQPFSFACGECGGEGEPTDIGRELYIESITVRQD
ncbi:MAG: hydrogenase maturation nickel metallochaperone HypA [Clostridiales Family XIII bacterium]|jgi:hydrogenase nickel incorporation protein HypA/HybF|nr:hydrogenase maturation nickel metallochaperone HypA [Clostridiales Family XIII bacterium]